MRRLSAVLFACLFASQSALLVLSPTLVEVAREFGVSTATVGQLRSISGLTGGITALVLATAPRRPGLRSLLSSGTALIAAGSALSACAPSFLVLAAAQVVLGIGIGLLVAVGIAAAGPRPRVLAWAIAGMPTAWIVGMPVVAALNGWRVAWLVLPGGAALVALALVRTQPPDAPSHRDAQRRPALARFAVGELLANAAWAAVLTYSGALLLESYGVSPSTVALGLGLMATAMLPGTFTARRRFTAAGLAGLTVIQATAVLALCELRLSAGLTLALLSSMAFVNGRRSVAASTVGMDSTTADRLTAMSLRAAANQLGYLLGAGLGGLALAVGGFAALGPTLAALFASAALIHCPSPFLPPVAYASRK